MEKNLFIIAGTISLLIAVVGALWFLCFAISYSLDRSERSECLEWQSEAREIENYYLKPWQDEQCKAQGVQIAAPVR